MGGVVSEGCIGWVGGGGEVSVHWVIGGGGGNVWVGLSVYIGVVEVGICVGWGGGAGGVMCWWWWC